MFKKALSILLAIMLVVSSVSITAISVAAADGEETVTYTVAGSSATIFNGTAWDASNVANDMILDAASGNYVITYTDVQPADAIQLKVVKDHAWDESYPEQNVAFNVKTACDVTVTFNPDTKDVTVTGDGVTQDTDLVVKSVIAVGNGEDTYLNGANWDPCDPANALTEDPENPGVWKIVMEDIYAFDNYQIKFAINSVDEEGNPTSNPWAHNFGSEEETQYPVNTELDASYDGKNCIFEVEEDESTVELTLDLRNFDFATKSGAKMRVDVTAPGAEETTAAPVEETTAAPAEETTAAPATQPAPSGDGLTVNATSNLFVADSQYYAENPDTVTVTYYMNVDKALQLQAIQFGIFYDPDYLTFDPDKNGFYDEDMEEYNYNQMFPVAGELGDVNPITSENRIMFAIAKWDGLKLRKNGELVPIATATFDVKDGAKGTTDVNCRVHAASLTNPKTEEDYIIHNVYGLQQEAYDFVTGGDPTTLYAVLAPEGTEPVVETTVADTTAAPETEPATTVAPETEPEPTTEPAPITDAAYTVAGSSAAIFNGTAWDASNEANDMTFNEATGLYEITYPNVQPEDAIQLKVVKDHGWDESYPEQNVSFNVKSLCDVKVTYNPETNEVKVEGDGVTFDDDLVPYSIIAVGNGEDTYLNGANWDPCDPANALTEVADGVWEMTMEDIYAFDNYQVKFAVNSVDEEGNPTSNPWAHNFGSEEETQYPVNTELDAFYDGKNCIFEVEEDGSTVKLQLDLRNFDFATKTGAKMTITVTAPEPEPTTEPVVTEEPTTTPAPVGDSLTVNATSNLFTPDQATYYYNSVDGVPETVTVTYYMDVDKALQLQAIQFGIYYDPEYLTFDPDKNGFYDEDIEEYNYNQMFPVAGELGDVNPITSENRIMFAIAKWDGLKLRKNGELVPIATATFDVKDGAKGTTDVNCRVPAASLTNPKTEEDYIIYNVNGLQQEAYDFVTGGDPSTLYAVIEPAGNTPVEPDTTEAVTTEEPTTEPATTVEPTTEPVAASTYTVAGSSAAIFNGTAWDASNEANDMTFNEATGLYEITYPNVQPEDAIQLKVVKDHGWDESYPEQNVSFNVKTACDVKVTYNPVTNEVKVEGDGVVFDEDLIVKSVIAVGNGEDTYLNGANWDPCDPANALTEVADGVWEMTMEDIYAFDNYQVKFAVNSVDEEGNPTSNPWAHNFGSEEETQYPVNTELDAFYDGKNCIFEVEEDGSTVKLQLDLRNFDFATKTGAKMTVTVTAPEPEPTSEPVVTEEPTTTPAPAGDSLTVNATSNLFVPDQATYYYNSVEGVPETVTVTYYMDVDKALQLQAIQFGIFYDPEYLTFDPDKNGFYDEDIEEYNYNQMFPVAGELGDVNPITSENRIMFAIAKWDGLKLRKNGELVPIATATFDVVDGAKGETTVNCRVHAASLTNPKTEEDYIIHNVYGLQQEAYDFVTGGDPSTLYAVIEPAGNTPVTEPATTEPVVTEEPTTEPVVTEEPTTEPVVTEEPTTEPVVTEEPTTEPVVTEEPTTEPVVTEEPTTEPVVTEEPTTEPVVTEEPTTEPVPTTVNQNLNVEAISNMFATQTKDAKISDTVEIAFNLDKAYTVDSFQWKMTYDDTKLKLNEVTTPGVDITVYNTDESGVIRAAASNAVDPFEYAEGDTFVLVKFDVIGGGDTTVDLNVQVFEEHEDEEPTTEPIVTEEPTTEPEPTEEPTTEPVVTEEPTTEPVVTEEPTTEPVVTEEPTTEPVVTEEPTTEPVVTEEPTTEPVVTEEPTTEPVVTEEPTTEPVVTEEPTTEPAGGFSVEGPETWTKGETEGPAYVINPSEAFKDVTVNGESVDPSNYTVLLNDDGTATLTFKPEYVNSLDAGTITVEFTSNDDATKTFTVTVAEPGEEGTTGEAATDATSATGEDTTNAAGGNAATSDSASGSSSSGAVQTGSASMAIIILLVLVSATAGIYFTRKRREDK